MFAFRTTLREQLLGGMLLAVAVGLAMNAQAEPLRVLLITGKHNHDWQATTAFMKGMYEDSGRFAVDVTETPETLRSEDLKPYDVLVDNWTPYPALTGRQWGPETEAAVLDFVRSGKGYVMFHASSAKFSDWPEFQELAGCAWSEAPEASSGHGHRHRFQVEVINPDHPITQGLPSFVGQKDELYHALRMYPTAQVLCTSPSTSDLNGTGRMEPSVLITDFGEGRVFHNILGHDVEAMAGVGWQTLMLRGTEWAATGRVTLPVPTDLEAPPIRAVVVTGGHSFDEKEFPKLFANQANMTFDFANQEDDSEIFEDIEAWPYHVIVLYNMSQKISDKRRKNLETLLERRVGLVALHHSVAAFQPWPAYPDIIGVKYFLEEEEYKGKTYPKCTYAHDTWFQLRVEDPDHPVTAGLSDFWVYDETYKGMVFAEDNHLLLTTEHPLGDRPIAWSRKYGDARVCFIQVGHGPQVFTDANYRRLVGQAVEWTAGVSRRP